jgi:hypothetical protein
MACYSRSGTSVSMLFMARIITITSTSDNSRSKVGNTL